MKRSIRSCGKAGRKPSSLYRKRIQSFVEFKQRKENERRNNVLRQRRLLLARNAIIRAVINGFKTLINFFKPKPPTPPEAAAAAMVVEAA